MNTTPTPTPTPTGFATLNPVFITRDPDGLIAFLRGVFGGEEHLDVRTVDIDGLLLHAELEIGGVTLTIAERKPDWPFLPQLTQIYVEDVESALARATARSGRIVTRPTDFFGTVFSRIVDPWGKCGGSTSTARLRSWTGVPPGARPTRAPRSGPTPTSRTSTGPSSRRCRPSAPNPSASATREAAGVAAGRRGGGCGIRTREGLHPTRFPSVRHRPLGESSASKHSLPPPRPDDPLHSTPDPA